ncbi:MAG TPA: ABC transporter permease [Terracidiphilus sp.]|nr:ABC transporter permease [Terracidiphilus sp.]
MIAGVLWRETRIFLRRNRWLSLLAVLIVVVGFTTSILTLLVMLALSIPIPGGMHKLGYVTIAQQMEGGETRPVSWTAFTLLKLTAGSDGMKLIPYSVPDQATLMLERGQQEVIVAGVSSAFFSNCVSGSLVGRDFSNPDVTEGTSNEVILSSHSAEILFGGPRIALGRSVRLNGMTYQVVGVAPKNFRGLWVPQGATTDAWLTPKNFAQLLLRNASGRDGSGGGGSWIDFAQYWTKAPMFYVLGVGARDQQKQMQTRLTDLLKGALLADLHWHASAGITDDEAHERKIETWAALSFLLSVVLIGASSLNFAGLLLAQVPKRVAEVRMKRALGGSGARIVLESIAGPMALFFVGLSVALVLAAVAIKVYILAPTGPFAKVPLPWTTIAASIALNLVVAIGLSAVVAMLPAIRLLRDSGTPQLGYTSTRNKVGSVLLQGFVSLQIASCIALCILAWGTVKAVRSLSKETLGFESSGLTVASIVQGNRKSLMMTANNAFDFPLAQLTRSVLIEAAGALPDNRDIAVATCAPSAVSMPSLSVSRMDQPAEREHLTYACAATQNFFRTIEGTLYEGSGFTSDSLLGRPTEVVINLKLAKELWPDRNPLNQTLRIHDTGTESTYDARIVGIAGNVRFADLTSASAATIYLPLRGNVFLLGTPPLYVLLRGRSTPHGVGEFIKQRLATSQTGLSLGEVFRAKDEMQLQRADEQYRGEVAVFGAMMVALIAYLGLFGSLMHYVNTRRKELAVRICFGATHRTIQRMVVAQALQSGLVAAVVALLGGRLLVQAVSVKWLITVTWSWTVGGMIAVLCIAMAIAISAFPAYAAAQVSPASVLKEQ